MCAFVGQLIDSVPYYVDCVSATLKSHHKSIKSQRHLFRTVCYVLFSFSYIYVSIYLRANQRVQPLDCLRMPDDTVHPVYVEHDLPQG